MRCGAVWCGVVWCIAVWCNACVMKSPPCDPMCLNMNWSLGAKTSASSGLECVLIALTLCAFTAAAEDEDDACLPTRRPCVIIILYYVKWNDSLLIIVYCDVMLDIMHNKWQYKGWCAIVAVVLVVAVNCVVGVVDVLGWSSSLDVTSWVISGDWSYTCWGWLSMPLEMH